MNSISCVFDKPPAHAGAKFRIGLSGCGGGLKSISTSRLLDLAEKVEALGFDAIWLNEEHFQGSIVEVEGRRCHSPLILAVRHTRANEKIARRFFRIAARVASPGSSRRRNRDARRSVEWPRRFRHLAWRQRALFRGLWHRPRERERAISRHARLS